MHLDRCIDEKIGSNRVSSAIPHKKKAGSFVEAPASRRGCARLWQHAGFDLSFDAHHKRIKLIRFFKMRKVHGLFEPDKLLVRRGQSLVIALFPINDNKIVLELALIFPGVSDLGITGAAVQDYSSPIVSVTGQWSLPMT